LEKPSLIEERLVFSGLRFSVVRRKYVHRGRGIFERDVVLFPQAVVVLPLLSDDEIVLIKQFRAPLGDFIIEAPAGIVGNNETPEEAAARELIEEAGYRARRLVKLGAYTPAPGYSSEVLHFYIARDLEYVGARPEKYEIIEPIKLSIAEAHKMVVENKISDMKTALVILLYLEAKRLGKLEPGS